MAGCAYNSDWRGIPYPGKCLSTPPISAMCGATLSYARHIWAFCLFPDHAPANRMRRVERDGVTSAGMNGRNDNVRMGHHDDCHGPASREEWIEMV